MATEQSKIAATVREAYENSISEFSKWSILRIIGNSTMGKAAIIVPVLGYLLLFNHEVVDFLKLHSSICRDCAVPWRLNLFYFGSLLIAIGSVLFGLTCPPVIDRHPGAHDFYEAEKDYYDAAEHRRFLVGHILKARATTYIERRFMYPATSSEEMLTTEKLSQLMGEHYFLQNRSRRNIRLTILGFYAAGAVLLAIPTVVTSWELFRRLLQG